MMDRFKFRFWYFNEVEKKWKLWICDLMSVDGTCLPFDNGEGGAYTDREHEFICEQCTGLKDKNDKLIYEGDIVKAPHSYKYEIKWSDGNWGLFFENGQYDICLCERVSKEVEIIGNIHENADLLGEE